MLRRFPTVMLGLALTMLQAWSSESLAENQTLDLSSVVVGGTLPFSTQILPASNTGANYPTLHSFAKAQYNGQWLVMSGLTGGLHDLVTGFSPQYRNSTVYVIDPNTNQVWSRSLATDPSSGLSQDQVDALSLTNAQFTQQGSHLYIAGGYGPSTSTGLYHTYDTLSSVDLPAMMDWVKGGSGQAASTIRQINDPVFQVTGGDMTTTSSGKTLLIFGQDYPEAYEQRLNGTYTDQVRAFTINDNGTTLGVANVVYGPQLNDFRRRDLNVVPIVRNVGGQFVQETQALAGVFTPSFGVWTTPVTIDANGTATEPDPLAASTFKQGMNSYHSASVGLYSASANSMHTLLFGGISYLYYDNAAHQVLADPQIPFVNDVTDVVTLPSGEMTQYLLSTTFPSIPAPTNGNPLRFGANMDFFLRDGIATYANGVIDLDAITGPTVIGYLYGGIAADAPNGGMTNASSYVFPVVISPVPEPCTLVLLGMGWASRCACVSRRRARSSDSRTSF